MARARAWGPQITGKLHDVSSVRVRVRVRVRVSVGKQGERGEAKLSTCQRSSVGASPVPSCTSTVHTV